MFMFATTNFLDPSGDDILPLSGNNSMQHNLLEENENDSRHVVLGWLPLVAIMLIAIGYHIGLSPITWSYTGKLRMNVFLHTFL